MATVLTQVEVDPADPAFQNPSKPIGTFMTEKEGPLQVKKHLTISLAGYREGDFTLDVYKRQRLLLLPGEVQIIRKQSQTCDE